MTERVLPYTLLVIHFGILAYLVFGGLLAWKWPRTLGLHVPLVAWAVISSLYTVSCPLTLAENWSRRTAGMPEYQHGFLETYVQGVLYPEHHVNWARAAVAMIILCSWYGVFLAVRRRRAATRASALLPLVPVAAGEGGLALRVNRETMP